MWRLLNTKEAARITGFKESYFEKKRRVGGGPPFKKIGKSAVRYPAEEFVAWFERYETVSSTRQRPRGPRRRQERSDSADKDSIVLRRHDRRGRKRVIMIQGIETPGSGSV